MVVLGEEAQGEMGGGGKAKAIILQELGERQKEGGGGHSKAMAS